MEDFKKYSPSSDEITLKYRLEKHIPNVEHFQKINLDAYENEFSSHIHKDKFDGFITISKKSTLREFKRIVSERTGFPINIMVGFGKWGGEEYDENGELWTIVAKYYIDENTPISQTHYNNAKITNRYIYIYIDITRDEIFSSINDNQIVNDKKFEKYEEEKKEDKEKINKLELKMDKLSFENSQNKIKISTIIKENRLLTERNKKEQERKQKHEKDKQDCNNEFKKEKNTIKDKKLNEWKSDIRKLLIKKYKKEFEEEGNNKSKSTITLINSFQKLLMNLLNKVKIMSNHLNDIQKK